MAKTSKKSEYDKDRCCDKCAYMYDPHEIGADGEPFLARCPFKNYSVFRRDPACREHFTPYYGKQTT